MYRVKGFPPACAELIIGARKFTYIFGIDLISIARYLSSKIMTPIPASSSNMYRIWSVCLHTFSFSPHFTNDILCHRSFWTNAVHPSNSLHRASHISAAVLRFWMQMRTVSGILWMICCLMMASWVRHKSTASSYFLSFSLYSSCSCCVGFPFGCAGAFG